MTGFRTSSFVIPTDQLSLEEITNVLVDNEFSIVPTQETLPVNIYFNPQNGDTVSILGHDPNQIEINYATISEKFTWIENYFSENRVEKNYLVIDDICIDPRGEIYTNGKKTGMHLTFVEYNLLKLLAVNQGEYVPTNKLLEEIWGLNYLVSNNSEDIVWVTISKLRRVLKGVSGSKEKNTYIQNVRGKGYKVENAEFMSEEQYYFLTSSITAST